MGTYQYTLASGSHTVAARTSFSNKGGILGRNGLTLTNCGSVVGTTYDGVHLNGQGDILNESNAYIGGAR